MYKLVSHELTNKNAPKYFPSVVCHTQECIELTNDFENVCWLNSSIYKHFDKSRIIHNAQTAYMHTGDIADYVVCSL